MAFALRVWTKKWSLALSVPFLTYVLFLVVTLDANPGSGFPGWSYVLLVVLPILLLASALGAYAAGPWLREKK